MITPELRMVRDPMIVLLTAALIGSLTTFAVLLPFGVLTALLSAPFGGSFLTLIAGLLLAFVSPRAERKQERSVQASLEKPKETVRVYFRWVAWFLILVVTAFTLSPIELRPVTAAPAGLERVAAFAMIGGAFSLGYPKHRLGIVLLVLGLIGLLEAAQQLVPGRHGRLPDGIMKASGALLGAAVVILIDRHKRAR
jgi:VanZ family protein